MVICVFGWFCSVHWRVVIANVFCVYVVCVCVWMYGYVYEEGLVAMRVYCCMKIFYSLFCSFLEQKRLFYTSFLWLMWIFRVLIIIFFFLGIVLVIYQALLERNKIRKLGEFSIGISIKWGDTLNNSNQTWHTFLFVRDDGGSRVVSSISRSKPVWFVAVSSVSIGSSSTSANWKL